MQSPDQPTTRRPRGPLGPPGRRATRRRGSEPVAPAEWPRGTYPPGAEPPGPGVPGGRGVPDDPNGPGPGNGPGNGNGNGGGENGGRRGVTRALGRARRLTHAQGMGGSGLSRMLEMNIFNAGGDAAMAVGLAGTMFFAVPSGEARGRIVLTLLLTMAPFAIVAPLIGPFLDRFRGGRRWAIGSTLALRAFLCWLLGDAIVSGSVWIYPLALACLVAQRAHGIARASATPRLLPPGMELVTANSRVYASGMIGTTVLGGIAGGLAFFGGQWPLRFAFFVYVIGTVLAIMLPSRVDSSAGEEAVAIGDVGRTLRGVPTSVVLALRANAAFRAFTGFLIMFMAFLIREHPLSGVPLWLQVGIVAGAAGAGNVVGTGLGALAEARRPEVVVQVLLAASVVVAVFGAIFYGLIAIAAVGLIGGFAQQLGKLSLDALIQDRVPEQVRTSVFARSETVLQLSWVLGGVLGILTPLIPQLGLGICAFGLLVGMVVVRRTATAPAR